MGIVRRYIYLIVATSYLIEALAAARGAVGIVLFLMFCVI